MDRKTKRILTVTGLGVAAVLSITLLVVFVRFTVVENGQIGIKFDLGHVNDKPVQPGLHFFVSLITKIERWSVKTQEVKETASVPSSEGLIAEMDVSTLYRIPVESVISLRISVGSNFKEVLVEPYIREAIRNVVSGYPIKGLYSEESRTKIGYGILAFLRNKLEPRGIVIEDVLLRDVRLPQVFSSSIELKLKTEQEAMQKEFELQKAKKDAEIAVAHAEGVAQANKVIANSITSEYLRYLWIQNLQSNNMQVIYVPTEGNLPILEAQRFGENKK